VSEMQHVTELCGVLVGMHFRPPAKLVLESLASGTPLSLRAEPTNEYDEWAVAVLVEPAAIPASQHERLASELPGCGWDLQELLGLPELHLGYLASGKNKILQQISGSVANSIFCQAREIISWEECSIRLGFAASGHPLVLLSARKS
jgi:hypothetical protein